MPTAHSQVCGVLSLRVTSSEVTTPWPLPQSHLLSPNVLCVSKNLVQLTRTFFVSGLECVLAVGPWLCDVIIS